MCTNAKAGLDPKMDADPADPEYSMLKAAGDGMPDVLCQAADS